MIGLTGVLLGLYLARLGVGAAGLGLIVGCGLVGNAIGTAFVTLRAARLDRRTALLLFAALAALGLAAVVAVRSPTLLGLAALIGMVSGAGRDRSPAQVLEQAVLADALVHAERTRVFARYALVQEVAGALGALTAGAPALAGKLWNVSALHADRWALAGGAAVLLVQFPLYLGLPPTTRSGPTSADSGLRAGTAHVASRRRLQHLVWLFGLDSLGGGFLLSAILSYWFFRRFGFGGAALGPVFFAARVLNAISYPCAAWLARRIGLVRTMVFTHLPSSAILLFLPLVAERHAVIALFLLRESLVQMDVPARQSYITAITEPGDRTYALAAAALVRNVGWAMGPPLAGLAITLLGLGAPLYIGASLKGAYDIALYHGFRRVSAPEERRPSTEEAPGGG